MRLDPGLLLRATRTIEALSARLLRVLGPLAVTSSLACGACAARTSIAKTPPLEPEVSTPTAGFVLDGKPFCFAGTNNYYLPFKPTKMVDDVLTRAASMGLKVIRTWGFIDRGSLDGTVGNTDGEGHKDGIYFQYWDPEAKRPAYNDGPDGLQRLDYVIAKAGQLGLKLIVTLTNNWADFGGMDQYLTWYGRIAHHEFYTAPEVKAAYRDWVAHVIQRVNSLNGRAYKEDSTILAWELANEPRCTNATLRSRREGWSFDTLTGWAAEMSAYIKELDSRHLVAVGDEGFFAEGDGPRGDCVDHAALTRLPHVDFATFHLYPDHWDMRPEQGSAWISRHLDLARRLRKPSVLEEYGLRARRDAQLRITEGEGLRNTTYRDYHATLIRGGGAGALFWMMAADDEQGQKYPDYDGFTVYPDDSTSALFTSLATQFSGTACPVVRSTADLPRDGFVRVVSVDP